MHEPKASVLRNRDGPSACTLKHSLPAKSVLFSTHPNG